MRRKDREVIEKNEMSKLVVWFEVKPTKEGMGRYLELAGMLKPMLAGFEGCVSAERVTSLNEEGKTSLFESYKITVCSVIREYSMTDRENAPSDSNKYFCK